MLQHIKEKHNNILQFCHNINNTAQKKDQTPLVQSCVGNKRLWKTVIYTE